MESPKCLCCGREIASGELCSDCDAELAAISGGDVPAALAHLKREIERENDEAVEAEWYAHVMAQYDATRRASGWRPGQE